LLCADTRFDRWARGELEFSDAELAGAATFIESGCARCHAGPAFSDGGFHNVGVPSTDRGRADGRELLASDPFNGAGAFSDDPDAGRVKLASVASEPASVGAFRTPSLRGVGQRAFFGHAAHEATLAGFIVDVYGAGGPGGGGDRGGRGPGDGDADAGGDGDGPGRTATVGTLDPLLDGVFVRGDVDELVAFLRTLDCPAPPASSLGR
jgi:cytochrome c peroxidase